MKNIRTTWLENQWLWYLLAVAFGGAVVLTSLQAIADLTSWYDEAFMADVVFNLGQGAGLTVGIMPRHHGEDVLAYGPVFFWLQQLPVSLFGFGEFSARLAGLVSGIGIALIITRIVYTATESRGYALAMFVLVMGDISFNRSMVSGRMDLLAVLFVFLSFAVARRALSGSVFWPVLLGIFASVAFLTTPRSAFLLLGVPALMLRVSARTFGQPDWSKHNLPSYGISGLVFLAAWGSWVAWAGGPGEYAATAVSGTRSFWGISLFRSFYDNLAIGTLLVLLVLYWKRVWRSEIFIGFFVAFMGFSLLAKQVGPYAGMVMPFVYALIALVLHAVIRDMGKPLRLGVGAVIMLIFALQVFVILSHNANLYVNSDCRDHRAFHRQVGSKMIPGATVLSEFRYYFAVRREAPKIFEVLEYNQANHVSELDPDYILIDARRMEKEHKDSVEARVTEMLERSYRPLARYRCESRSLGALGDRIAGFTYTNRDRTYRNATLYGRESG